MSIAADTMRRLDAGATPWNLATEPYRGDRVPPSIFAPGTQYPEWDGSRAVTEGYQQCSILAQVVGDLAEKAASRPWYWWEIGSGRHGTDKRLEPVEAIENPDPFIPADPSSGMRDRATQHEEEVVDFFLAGHSYTGIMWQGGKALRQKPLKMKREDPVGVAPHLDSMGRLDGWEWDSASRGGYRYWEARDILQVKWKPAGPGQDPHLGFSLLWPLGTEVDSYVELTKMQLGRIRRGGMPGDIYTDEAITTEEEAGAVEESLNRGSARRFGGWLVAGGTGEKKVHQAPSFNARQLQLLETLGYLRDRIWTTFGPHPALISSDASTLDNLNVANRTVWSRVVLINQRYSRCYTQRFVPPDKRGKLVIAPDYSDVPELNEMTENIDNLAKLTKDCEVAVNAGIGLLRMGLDDQPGGDLVLTQGSNIPKEQAGEGLDDE